MVFIETPVFTRQVTELLTDEDYGQFQQCLAAHPKMGKVIQGTGGLRKVRWSDDRGGKSGGVRVVYYHVDTAFSMPHAAHLPQRREGRFDGGGEENSPQTQ